MAATVTARPQDWNTTAWITFLARVIAAAILFNPLIYGDLSWGREGSLSRLSNETTVGRIDASSLIKESFTVSPDGRRAAYVVKSSDKQYVVADGIEQEHFDEISGYLWGITFSPDSKRIAYHGRLGEKWFAVLDGREINGFHPVAYNSPVFSPDSRRFAFEAKSGKQFFNVIDGKAEEGYEGDGVSDGVSTVQFSPDSKRTAYIARSDGKAFIVLDGKRGREYGVVGAPGFSPDGTRLAYSAYWRKAWTRRGQNWFEVIDGKEGSVYWRVWDRALFSPDSRRTAYAAHPTGSNETVIVLDGEEIARKGVSFKEPVFSADSKSVYYRAKSGAECFLVAQGIEGRGYDFVRTPSFSPDGTVVVYVASKGGKQCVVANGTEGRWYDRIYPRRWRERVVDDGVGFSSPDRFYYFALQGDRLLFVEENLSTRPSPTGGS